MSIEKIERELRENLDGVTKGPWRPGHLANDDHSCDCGFVFDCQDRMGSIATVNMDDGGQFGKEYPSRDEAKANLKHIVAAQPENIRALLDELSRLREDAERWRALMSSQRMHFMGCAGIDLVNKPGTTSRKTADLIPVMKPGEYHHFGMEFWSEHKAFGNPEYPDDFERSLLIAYVDDLRASALSEREGQDG